MTNIHVRPKVDRLFSMTVPQCSRRGRSETHQSEPRKYQPSHRQMDTGDKTNRKSRPGSDLHPAALLLLTGVRAERHRRTSHHITPHHTTLHSSHKHFQNLEGKSRKKYIWTTGKFRLFFFNLKMSSIYFLPKLHIPPPPRQGKKKLK